MKNFALAENLRQPLRTLLSKNLTTLNAIKKICQAINYPSKNVGFAGMKDATAIARQHLSFQLVEPAKFENLDLKSVRILDIKKHNRKLRRGQLRGNRFTCIIRDVEENAEEIAKQILDVISKKGLPNYYGEQRFGRAKNNHILGMKFLKKDFKGFIEELFKTIESESKQAFDEIQEGNFVEAEKLLKPNLNTEKKVLKILARTNDFEKAVKSIHRKLKQLYISALQSQLFNLLLDKRLEDNLIDAVVEGDVAYIHRNGAAFVVEDAAEENPRCAVFKISPSGAIYGTKSLLAENEPGKTEREILKSHDLKLEDFKIGEGLTQKGARRPYRVPVTNIEITNVNEGLKIKFTLPAGAYATNLLQELTKPAIS